MQKINLSGRYGKLTIVGFVDGKWEYRCDCGMIKRARGADIRAGKVVSCGCHKNAMTSKRLKTHGASRDGACPEYAAWKAMKTRCLNPNFHSYHRYGGRGITVCARWIDSFENFLKDMGNRPTPKHTLDRKKNDEDYSPENCHWATRLEQSRNSTRPTLITFDGKTMNLTQWAETLGHSCATLCKRLARGWSIQKTLTHK